jgi:hypothetical protein
MGWLVTMFSWWCTISMGEPARPPHRVMHARPRPALHRAPAKHDVRYERVTPLPFRIVL